MTYRKPDIGDYQIRVVNGAIGASAMRNQGPPGTIRLIREYLFKLRMDDFVGIGKKDFDELLDRHTQKLRAKIIKWISRNGGRKWAKGDLSLKYWGTARKALNTYLMLACNHRVVSEYYRLQRIVSYLEVPLDSYVANGLHDIAGGDGKGILEGETLPKWHGIKYLGKDDSLKYQRFALKYSQEKLECNRVELDLIFWRRARADKADEA